MNNVNLSVSKIYRSGLIFGMLIGFHIWGACIQGGLYMGGLLTGFYDIYIYIYIVGHKNRGWS